MLHKLMLILTFEIIAFAGFTFGLWLEERKKKKYKKEIN